MTEFTSQMPAVEFPKGFFSSIGNDPSSSLNELFEKAFLSKAAPAAEQSIKKSVSAEAKREFLYDEEFGSLVPEKEFLLE